MAQQVIVDIPASHIVDFDTVSQEIKDAHSFSPDERAEALGMFVMGAETDFDIPLGDLAKTAATQAAEATPDKSIVKKSLFSSEKPNGDSIEVTVDSLTGEVTDASVVTRIAEDRRATSRGKHISRTMRSGPPTNGAGFRTNIADPGRIR